MTLPSIPQVINFPNYKKVFVCFPDSMVGYALYTIHKSVEQKPVISLENIISNTALTGMIVGIIPLSPVFEGK